MRPHLMLAVSVLLCGWGCSSQSGTGGSVQDTVRVKSLIVVDESGKDRVWIGTKQIGERTVTGVFILDADGKRRMGMGTNDEGVGAVVGWDKTETPRAILGTGSKIPGGAGIAVLDPFGKPKVRLGIADDYTGEVRVDGHSVVDTKTLSPTGVE